jgi:formylglycine-generating enzyme
MNHTQSFNHTPLVFNMIALKGGTFEMGRNDYDDEKPIHPVSLNAFAMGEHPVTQALWAWVMQDTDLADPSNFKGANHPVEQVSWEDITAHFLPKLNALTLGLRPEGSLYLLPTEAEWEYAAKGGQYWKEFPFKYVGSDKLNEVGWYRENSHNETKPVGLKTPNLLGLYDMSGNVWEWCSDKRKDWDQNYEDVIKDSVEDPITGALVNPTGVVEGSNRVLRGGSWLFDELNCRPTHRNNYQPSNRLNNIGFRLVLFYPSV